MFCMKCVADLGANPPAFCPQCGAVQDSIPKQTELPMKWFKFVIYVQLFLNALVSVVNVVSYLSGSFASNLVSTDGSIPAYMVYEYLPGLWPLVVVLAVLSAGMAVWSIVVRQWLAHYQWRGVQGLYILYGLAIASGLVMMIGMSVVLHSFAVGLAAAAPSLIAQVVVLVLSRIYFNKRRHLFH